MIRRKISSAFFLLVLLSLTSISVSIPSCSANYANWGILTEGASFHNGTHISMPFANVEINITRTASVVYTLLTSEFHVVTSISQNATLAFVYPSPIPDRLLYNSSSYEENPSMKIFGNGTLYNYTIFDYDGLIESGFTEDFSTEYSFVQSWINFAVFSIELTANSTMVLSTISTTNYKANMDKFDYDYVVGSARTFKGHTIERVHFQVIEEVPFSSTKFSPNESLSITNNGFITDAVWEFNITEFPYDVLAFDAEYQSQDVILNNMISSVIIIAIIIITLYQFGYKKVKKT